jgi:nicotinamidase-related amidase
MPSVLFVDMQVDFFAHQRLSQRRADLVTSTNGLIAIARRAGAPVVWIKQEFSPDLADASLEVRRSGIRVVISGTAGASMLPELDVRAADRVFIKRRYSAFFGTDLEACLVASGCQQLIVAGINTHACIRATVVDAYQRDYDIILARDCIESHDRDHHEITLRYLDGKLGRGMSNDQIRAVLGGR